ncbi:MAG: NDP-sugar synthase, partial [Dehalococcoidia bacterium]
RFIEKPRREEAPTNMINAGTYILESSLLEYIPANENYMFERGLFPLLLERGEPFYSFSSQGYWIDIGTPEKYMKVNNDLLTGDISTDIPGSVYNKKVWAEEGHKIHPKARIDGPVVIGRDCFIEAQAHIVGPSVIGPHCYISAGSLVEKSILWHNVAIGKDAKIRQSIVADAVNIGEDCDISAGCIIGNNVSIENSAKLPPETKIVPCAKITASQTSGY